MKTTTINVVDFEDLNEDAQNAIIEENRYINVDWEWYRDIIDNYLTLGIKVGYFDLEKDIVVSILTTSVEESIQEILNNVSPTNELCNLVKSITDSSNISSKDYLDKINPIILKELKEAYNYLISDEAVIDTVCKFRRIIF
ncbi:MAG TPA: hypothetical protein P5513_07700 [Candidatus Diapherotrites archaeon]|nr:hypothetical protein [Candidatus Diapherotrites archaeon]